MASDRWSDITIAIARSASVLRSRVPRDVPTRVLHDDGLLRHSTACCPRAQQHNVALATILVCSSAPAGYALARFRFPGRDGFQVGVLVSKMFPIAILSIPLAVTFIDLGLYDTLIAVILVHTAMVLPFIVIVTSGVFLAVSRELEEAAQTLGTSRFGAFTRIALPLALPGLAAAAIFSFVTSWNEVFAATILTVRNTTLPAQVLASLNISPLYFRFAGGFFMIIPSLFFIFFMRKYLFNLWGPGR